MELINRVFLEDGVDPRSRLPEGEEVETVGDELVTALMYRKLPEKHDEMVKRLGDCGYVKYVTWEVWGTVRKRGKKR